MSNLIGLLAEPQAWISLLTLTVLEVVLGIDNLIFVAILAGRLPAAQQAQSPQREAGSPRSLHYLPLAFWQACERLVLRSTCIPKEFRKLTPLKSFDPAN